MTRARGKREEIPHWRGTARPGDLARRLLAWYDADGRNLAWRRRDGGRPDPYRVWLSEIMLQQTNVATVARRFDDFVQRWPDVRSLAAAELDEVLTTWAGLGYYARARNLHRCAGIIAGEMGGRFPESEAELRTLPGIGDYTSAAISAIAFDRRSVVIDGNVERVLSRLGAIGEPRAWAGAQVRALAERLTPALRAGDYAQALMDLGATICTARSPRCSSCPWAFACRALAAGEPEAYPRKAAKAKRPQRFGVAFWVSDGEGRVALRRRPENGLLGGMMEVPGTEWRDRPWSSHEATRQAPIPGPWRWLDGGVRHVFTHFALELQVAAARIGRRAIPQAVWLDPGRLGEVALPTVMRKVANLAMAPGAGFAPHPGPLPFRAGEGVSSHHSSGTGREAKPRG